MASIKMYRSLGEKPSIREMRSRKRNPIYILADNIRSLYNVGAIFRSSDAALVRKIFLTGITGKPPHKDIDKSALGATNVVPWEYCRDSRQVISELKSQGIFVVGLEITKKSVPYTDLNYKFPLCLVVGNEVSGISEDVLELCDAIIDIPMLGQKNSLNVSVAHGIALFEILRQFRKMRVPVMAGGVRFHNFLYQ